MPICSSFNIPGEPRSPLRYGDGRRTSAIVGVSAIRSIIPRVRDRIRSSQQPFLRPLAGRRATDDVKTGKRTCSPVGPLHSGCFHSPVINHRYHHTLPKANAAVSAHFSVCCNLDRFTGSATKKRQIPHVMFRWWS